ncbi:hypothetical protein CMI37_33235 [Candidatus Pacearchaeota archaeon]|nr:hypothetical protein [Candidatus Pacearchaeota archaeon]|tara:strand:+ start:3051 stop:3311 length:261 start_codon:yes stop_codon:yes gene_type:complete
MVSERQLETIQKSLSDHGGKLLVHLTRLEALEDHQASVNGDLKDIKGALSEIKGGLSVMKWAVPIAISGTIALLGLVGWILRILEV